MKRRTNVSIDEELFQSAKKQELILSSLLEQAIREELKKRAQHSWVEENKDNLKSYNKRIAENGVFSDHLRSF